MKKHILPLAIVIGIVVLGGIYALVSSYSSGTKVLGPVGATSTASSTVSTQAPAASTQSAPARSSAPSVSSETSAGHAYVTITAAGFSPQALTIKAGTIVTWTNRSASVVGVLGSIGGPTSGQLVPGQSYSFRYGTPGIYGYHTAASATTTGTIIVD